MAVKAASKTSEEAEELKGFEDVSDIDPDGYFKPAQGASFQGKIIGCFFFQEEDDYGRKRSRPCVLVKLSKPCTFVSNETGKLEAGEILGVGIRAKLAALLEYVEHKGECFVKATEQTKLTRGRTLWHFKVLVKGKKGAIPRDVRNVVPAVEEGAPF